MLKIFNTKVLYVFLLLAIVLTACGNPATSTNTEKNQISSEADNKESTPQATEVSGKLMFYTSQPDADAEKLVTAFKQKFPKVEVSVFRSGTEEVISKILAEKQAGSIQADVLLVADSVTFESLKQQNLLFAYKSAETTNISSNFVDPDGMYTGTKVMATALVVNTAKVKEIPDSWNVLIDEKAKGQSIMPSPFYSGAAAYNLGVFTRNNDFNWDFYNMLKDNEVTVTKGNGGVLQAVASGEKSYGMVVDFIVARAEKDGSPVTLVYPKEGVPVITEPVGIIKGTKNEAAAKAFVDFILSDEGQQLQAELGYTPIRKGISAPEGLRGINDMKVIEAEMKELFANRESDKKRFGEIFGQ